MPSSALPRLEPQLAARLYERSHAGRWGLTQVEFQASLEACLANVMPGEALASDAVRRFLEGLHLEDLALAVACREGLEPAWDHFVQEYRPLLYRAAAAIAPAEAGRELADSLYADLFGLEVRAGRRQSLFRYFHGRSKLTTWLRAVLAQRHVDRLRASRRLEPLPDEDSTVDAGASTLAGSTVEQAEFADAMRDALTSALATLAARDRLRLACYYGQDMTLAAIGRLLDEHEATVSRHLARARREVRASIEAALRSRGMDDAAIAECFRSVIEDVGALDLAELMGGSGVDEVTVRKKVVAGRSKE